VVTLQHVGPEGWHLWREVRLQALAEAPYAFSSSLGYWQGPGDTKQRWQERLRDVALNVVAVSDGRGVGQVSGCSPDDGGVVELISMWVAPDTRGSGIGDALVAEVVQWARECGATEVKLAVMDDNTPAIVLYRRHGFTLSNEPPPVDGQLTMALSLQSSSRVR
jgi:ribosomal protein S18 acetylase RimI-like enzyme